MLLWVHETGRDGLLSSFPQIAAFVELTQLCSLFVVCTSLDERYVVFLRLYQGLQAAIFLFDCIIPRMLYGSLTRFEIAEVLMVGGRERHRQLDEVIVIELYHTVLPLFQQAVVASLVR